MSRIESCVCCRAGVADQDVEPAEPFDRLRDQLLAEGLVAQVAGNGDAVAARLLDQLDDLLRVRLFGREIVDRDVRALARIGDRGGAAHAGIAAGDQRLAARSRPEPL